MTIKRTIYQVEGHDADGATFTVLVEDGVEVEIREVAIRTAGAPRATIYHLHAEDRDEQLRTDHTLRRSPPSELA
jgi:hypothetical protein